MTRYLKFLDQLFCRSAILVIRFYKRWVSPYIAPRCRFYPTCSSYAIEVFREFGFVMGSWYTVRRILKCHPFHPGGVDMPPRKDQNDNNA